MHSPSSLSTSINEAVERLEMSLREVRDKPTKEEQKNIFALVEDSRDMLGELLEEAFGEDWIELEAYESLFTEVFHLQQELFPPKREEPKARNRRKGSTKVGETFLGGERTFNANPGN